MGAVLNVVWVADKNGKASERCGCARVSLALYSCT